MTEELQLDRRTIDIVLNTIKARINPELDIMGFYGYDEETKEYLSQIKFSDIYGGVVNEKNIIAQRIVIEDSTDTKEKID